MQQLKVFKWLSACQFLDNAHYGTKYNKKVYSQLLLNAIPEYWKTAKVKVHKIINICLVPSVFLSVSCFLFTVVNTICLTCQLSFMFTCSFNNSCYKETEK